MNPARRRRVFVRLAVLFVVGQVMAAVGVLFSLPIMQTQGWAPVLLVTLVVVDLALVVYVVSWLGRVSDSAPIERLSNDVLRISDGDFHHRIGDPRRSDLRVIRDSVNRLADRLITDQRQLAENVRSLEDTNRELVLVRDELVRSARLASVGTLAAGIAHEVGNPLGAVIGFVDVARSRAAKAGNDVELLDSIRTEASRIDRIVRGLLDYARPSEAGGKISRAPEVIARVRDLLESQGTLDGIEHEWMIDGATDHWVGEPHRLEQVLVNLLLNSEHALRATAEPRIVVRLSEEEGRLRRLPKRRGDDPPGINYTHRRRSADDSAVDAVAHAERLTVIEVSDNGPGIEEKIVDHLFDPFFTTKEPGEGTGLGLAICARLVEGMGGRIDVAEGIDGGASFVIRLPLSDHAGAEPERSTTSSQETVGQ